MKFASTPLVVCALAALLAPSAASAQDPTPPQSDQPQPASVRRPFRGIFAPPADPTTSKQSMDLTFSIFGAYDDDVFAADQGSTGSFQPGSQRRGGYGGATAGLVYTRPGDRVSLGLDGDAGVNRYPRQNQTTEMYRAGGNLGWRLGRQTRLSLGGDVVYAPQYRLGLFANPAALGGEADPFSTITTDLDLFNLTAYRTSAQVSLSQGLGRRSSIEGYYALGNVNYVDNKQFDYGSYAAGVRFAQRLSRNLGLHLGYSYHEAKYDHPTVFRPQRVHNIDAGVDYGRALSLSRRTSLSFSTGSSVLVRDNTLADAGSQGYNFRFTGEANLSHEMGRTWTAQLGYRRGVDFHEGFNDPFLSDAVTGSLDGLFSRHLRFSSSADYSIGQVGFGTSNHYDSASATAGLEYALSRTLALFGRYVYYRYNFDAGVVLDPRFARGLDRQGVRIGLNASLPIVR